MISLFVLVSVFTDSGTDSNPQPELIVVSRRVKRGEEHFAKYARQFDITPEAARNLVGRYRDSLPLDERHSLGVLTGMVNEEYVFSFKSKDARFWLDGYRVNARTGAARWVSVEDVRATYGNLFLEGYIPARDLSKYAGSR